MVFRQSNKFEQNNVPTLIGGPRLEHLTIFAPYSNVKMADLCHVVLCAKKYEKNILFDERHSNHFICCEKF
jgi:hypothetical protein